MTKTIETNGTSQVDPALLQRPNLALWVNNEKQWVPPGYRKALKLTSKESI